MLKSSVCDQSDAYILIKGTIPVAAPAAGGGNNNKKSIANNCAPFADYIGEINNT